MEKVEKMKENQMQRIEKLVTTQEENRRKAELIMANSEIIEEIICTVRRAIMMQMSWPDIVHMFLELARQGNSVFSSIHGFKLETNQITLSLW